MEKQLSLFEQSTRRKRIGNPYRSIDGRYCTKQEAEISAREREIRKLERKTAYLERQAEMYERMALALSKRLTRGKR